jgi:hypothetical protein
MNGIAPSASKARRASPSRSPRELNDNGLFVIYCLSCIPLFPSSSNVLSLGLQPVPHSMRDRPLLLAVYPKDARSVETFVPNKLELTRTHHPWFLTSYVQVPKGRTSHVLRISPRTFYPPASSLTKPLNKRIITAISKAEYFRRR